MRCVGALGIPPPPPAPNQAIHAKVGWKLFWK